MRNQTIDICHDEGEYERTSPALKVAVQEWIRLVIQPAQAKNRYHSYGLKHFFEDSVPFTAATYMSNGEFKGAMLAAGYEPVNRDTQNWTFRMKTRSTHKRYSSKHMKGYGPDFGNFCICHCSEQEREAYCDLIASLSTKDR